jgi:hypothetical protein
MTYDQMLTALKAVMADCREADSYATRLNAVAGFLNATTSRENFQNGGAVGDELLGYTKGNDWFFAAVTDEVKGSERNDAITTIQLGFGPEQGPRTAAPAPQLPP